MKGCGRQQDEAGLFLPPSLRARRLRLRPPPTTTAHLLHLSLSPLCSPPVSPCRPSASPGRLIHPFSRRIRIVSRRRSRRTTSRRSQPTSTHRTRVSSQLMGTSRRTSSSSKPTVSSLSKSSTSRGIRHRPIQRTLLPSRRTRPAGRLEAALGVDRSWTPRSFRRPSRFSLTPSSTTTLRTADRGRQHSRAGLRVRRLTFERSMRASQHQRTSGRR